MKPSMPTVKVVEDVFTAMNEQPVDGDLNEDYVEKLKTLSAETWTKQPSGEPAFSGVLC